MNVNVYTLQDIKILIPFIFLVSGRSGQTHSLHRWLQIGQSSDIYDTFSESGELYSLNPYLISANLNLESALWSVSTQDRWDVSRYQLLQPPVQNIPIQVQTSDYVSAAETEAVERICVTNPPERKIFYSIVFTDKSRRRKSGSWFRNGFVRMECSRTHVPSTWSSSTYHHVTDTRQFSSTCTGSLLTSGRYESF